jgi:hypothetical protein
MLQMDKLSTLAIVRRQVLTGSLLVLLLSVGCSRSVTPPGDEDASSAGGSAQDQRPLPFHGDAGGEATSSNPLAGGSDNGSNHIGVPFASFSTGNLAAGTLLTVRLTDSLSGTSSSSGSRFTASLDNRVVANGRTLLTRGTLVRGKVESFQASEIKGDRGFVRVTLISMRVDGKEVPLQSSSLFARGEADPHAGSAAILLPVKSATTGGRAVCIERGRLLTFRLTSPVSFPLPEAAELNNNSSPSGK